MKILSFVAALSLICCSAFANTQPDNLHTVSWNINPSKGNTGERINGNIDNTIYSLPAASDSLPILDINFKPDYNKIDDITYKIRPFICTLKTNYTGKLGVFVLIEKFNLRRHAKGIWQARAKLVSIKNNEPLILTFPNNVLNTNYEEPFLLIKYFGKSRLKDISNKHDYPPLTIQCRYTDDGQQRPLLQTYSSK